MQDKLGSKKNDQDNQDTSKRAYQSNEEHK